MSGAKWFAATIGLGAASYAACVGKTWLRYGKPNPAQGENVDAVLDLFMPVYDVVDRHKIRIAAPADLTLSAATELALENCSAIRGIFKARGWILGSEPDSTVRPRALLAQMKSLGWGVLAELPGREIVLGAATKPWEPNPVFRSLPPDEFAAFHEPGYVKIIWTLRADPNGNGASVFRTETRAVATDSYARTKFRRYWSFLSPGIIMIRNFMLPRVKVAAERRCKGNEAKQEEENKPSLLAPERGCPPPSKLEYEDGQPIETICSSRS
jgi:hypothetical protein